MADDTEPDTPERDAPVAPWSVKGVSRERRDAINAAARRADMTVGEYIWDACDAKMRASLVPFASPATALARHTGASLVDVDVLVALAELALRLSADDATLRQTEVLKVARQTVSAHLRGLAHVVTE